MAELYEARQAIRPDKEKLAERQLQKAYGEKYNPAFLSKSRIEASRLLNEDVENRTVTQKIPKSQSIIEQHVKKRRSKGRGR
ncbi:MAG: hypothetical protein K2J73_10550 [Oscillospiraceae bacterium]|nr:hypothetical protein [Oscillospiraceae bacterium]